MVRTRHSGEGEVGDSPKLLSLSNERQRKRFSAETENGNDGQNTDNEESELKVNTRLRPRVGPDRTYNYLDEDSSEEDSFKSRRIERSSRDSGLRRRSRQMKEDLCRDSQQDMMKKGRLSQQTSRRSQRQSRLEVQHSVTEEDEEEETSPIIGRRSSRTRRQVYDTLNQSYILSYHPGQKREDNEIATNDEEDEDKEIGNENFTDMYSRVKRKRIHVKRNMYGVPINDDSDSDQEIPKRRNRNNNKTRGGHNEEEEDDDEEEEEDDDEEEEEEDEDERDSQPRTTRHRFSLRKRKRSQPVIVKSYSLREHKPRTVLYTAPVEEKRIRRTDNSLFPGTPQKQNPRKSYQSPAQRRFHRKRSAFHSSSSSTSSSSDGESNDENSFKRRKAKSMAKARSRMMPMNFSANAMPSSSVIKDRQKSGASLADVEPMTIDKNVTFNSIGGLGKHIRALKEMVVFPLLYDKVFQRFKVDPPRGVLFHGPPGTGKTLVARALANECSQGDKKVAFFMRKGADCLSKWVGESERQLRLLFDQAYTYRPSIIFFDEIDGLAPVRSSRQDQIHSSIVSTLLALMDGLDSRGEIVVIGATNRIDSLDPALRRPGRFDREFLFPLPSVEARKQILKIHTKSWTPNLNDRFLSELAEKTVGYCGADLKALCTEAAMFALRRHYPQIYISNEALQLDESAIQVSAKDFFDGVSNIIPTSQRAVNTPARALNPRVCPLLQRQLDKVMAQLEDCFPLSLGQSSSLDAAVTSSQAAELAESGAIWDEMASDEDENAPSIFVNPVSQKSSKRSLDSGASTSKNISPFLNFTSYASSRPVTFRPRVLLVGKEGQGQTTHIAPAVVHQMENLPVHVLDLPALYAVSAKTPEESCANVFHEAKRHSPSIVYLPYISQWWDVMAETLRATLLTLIQDLDPAMPLLLLATSEQPYDSLDPMLQSLFSRSAGEVVHMSNPNKDEREEFFRDLLLRQACRPPPKKKQAAQRLLEVLPKAGPSKPKELTKAELQQLEEKEELTLMELRIFLRDVLNKLGNDKKFSIFTKPVNIEDAPDYYEVIEHPMDMSTMMAKIDLHEYNTVRAFIKDIDLICCNALEYNPNRGPMDRVIRHRACALKDTAYAIIKTELDKDFEKMCVEIEESRKRRGDKSKSVPNFYYTKPAGNQQQNRPSQPVIPSYLEQPKLVRSIPEPEGERFSRRVRGLTINPTPPLEAVEKVYKSSRSASSPSRDCSSDIKKQTNIRNLTPNCNNSNQGGLKGEPTKDSPLTDTKKVLSLKSSTPKVTSSLKSNATSSSKDSKRKRSKCVWCRPKRKRPRLTFSRKPQTTKEETDKEEDEGNEDEESSQDDEEKEEPIESTKEQLSVNVEPEEEESGKDLKSPASRNIRSRSSPGVSSPSMGVSTRRNSMSPRGSHHQEPIEQMELSQSPLKTMPELAKEAEPVISSEPAASLETTDGLPTEKPSVVKRLDLESVLVDSGVGSSVDSNGDSRDSSDHTTKSSTHPTVEEEPKVSEEVEKDENHSNNSKLQKQASSMLDEPSQTLVVDKSRLQALLHRLVAHTEGVCVERLEKLYSQLSMVIHRHRHSYDRTPMLKDLEQKCEILTCQSPSTSRARHF